MALIFKGFKQVTLTKFNETSDKLGYLWFVRTPAGADGIQDDSYDIYFGEKHYGHFQEGELEGMKESIATLRNDLGFAHDDKIFGDAKTVKEAFAAVTTSLSDLATLISGNTDAIEAEVERATSAETALNNAITANTAAITAEKERAEAKEAELNNAITANTAAITAETNRATSAETALNNAITANTAAITAEKERAESKEAELNNAITAETNRATSAETELREAINAIDAAAKSYAIESKTEGLDENIEVEYTLYETVGESKTEKGTIQIKKDSSLISIDLVDEKPVEGGESIKGQFLQYTYRLENGKVSTIYVDANKFLVESEFKNGLQVNSAGEVSVKTVEKEDNYIKVDETGVYTEGINEAISTAASNAVTSANTYTDTLVEAETNRATSAETALNNAITANTAAITAEKERAEAKEAELNNAITANTAAITAETNRATSAETELRNFVTNNYVSNESFEEFESELETKLGELESGAEVNVIESITVNGVDAIVDGNKHATVTIDTDDIMHGEGESAATVSSVLQGIQTSIDTINSNTLNRVEAGNGISVSAFSGNTQYISAKLSSNSDNVLTFDENGGLYVPAMIYSGDDAE